MRARIRSALALASQSTMMLVYILAAVALAVMIVKTA